MDYHEAANFLFDLRRFQVKPGTESVRELLAHLGDPHEDVRFVQVAGSNGKGSTAKMVESVLRESGLRVGLYTSPHFDDVRERIRVDGRKIPEKALCAFVEEAKPYLVEQAAAGEPLTFFEVVTAMGIWQFGRVGVDVGVLEVGMGGKLDATSVVDPVASAVTNVSLEHTSVLGDTIEEIATKKAAVAPADTPLVTAATGEALDVIRREAGDVVTVGDEGSETDVTAISGGPVNHTESTVTVDGPDWHVESRIPLLGAYQATNAGVACALATQITDVDEETLARGLRNAHWPGRFEVMERDPLVVLDGAHNPDACTQLATTLDAFADEYEDLHLVFAAMHDKNHREMVDALPDADAVVTCKPNLSRAEDPEVLARVFQEAGVDDVHAGFSVAGSLAKVRENAAPDDCILITGSLFCVAEARTTWTRLEIPKRVRTLDDAEAMLHDSHVTEPGVWRMRGKAVHRSLKLHVERRQAQYLKEEMLSLGGECATSGLQTDGELSSVVLMGTLAQFNRLVDKLAGQPFGLDALRDDIRERLGIRVEATKRGYPWEDGTAVMGILNVTPDSFHDGGDFFDPQDAVEQAEAMIDAGVDIIDIGGESTRPGAEEVPVDDEIARVVPVIEAIADLDVHLSIDTRKAAVGRAALDAGADILNDVTGLADPEMRFLAAERDVPVIVMHSIDAPVIPDKEVEYDDVVEDVVDELAERVLLAEKAGIPRENVIVDPGIGFGKSKPENFELLGRLDEFDALGCPILVGHSHKSMFELVGQETGDNLEATVAATTVAVDRGADIVRVHDVAENVAAVRVAEAARSPKRFDEE
ncbi:dihydropteroate synthase [Halogranum rubrum]|uniref:Probable bifunctional folylpolyglutamate synthase/dihydropteroate synthase n=1 Tax=Halogranum salarium B-1 TaxID=1210908 RepID=J3JGU3_9EURY|nr:dihydropteroate synthase [Halogranum salarium]EJN60396.1 dihydropteroate synthase [Halogranum salarium B-1]